MGKNGGRLPLNLISPSQYKVLLKKYGCDYIPPLNVLTVLQLPFVVCYPFTYPRMNSSLGEHHLVDITTRVMFVYIRPRETN